MSQNPIITAEVFLVTPSGKSALNPDKVISVNNINEYRPLKSTVEQATDILKSMGFNVLLAGLTLTISGPLPLFKDVFKITFDHAGGYPSPINDPTIPSSLRHLVEGITFGTPAQLSG